MDDSIRKNLIDIANKNYIPKDHIDYLKKIRDKHGVNPNVIYDIGSCVLHWTKIAKQIWPHSKLICFEGNSNLEFLYKDKNIQYFFGVLSDKPGREVDFYLNNEIPHGSSYYRENPEVNESASVFFPDESRQKVITETVDSVCLKNGFPKPDLVKIDVQGCEIDILKGMVENLSGCKDLIIELQHTDYNIGAKKSDESISIIKGLGFELVTPRFSFSKFDGDYHFRKVRT